MMELFMRRSKCDKKYKLHSWVQSRTLGVPLNKSAPDMNAKSPAILLAQTADAVRPRGVVTTFASVGGDPQVGLLARARHTLSAVERGTDPIVVERFQLTAPSRPASSFVTGTECVSAARNKT